MDDAAGQGTQKVKGKNMSFGDMVFGVKFAAAGFGIVAAVTMCAAQEGGTGQPADLVKNGSFEVRGQENVWKLPEGWSISRGFGRNGGGGLVFEVSEPLKERKWPEQIVDVEPGRIYDLSAWVDANLDSPRNIAVVAQFLDKKGKVIASSRTIAHGPKKKWGKISARTKRTPGNANRARIRLLVPDKATGKACFDDVSFTVFKVDPVTVLCSSCYRNEAVNGEPPVVFYAGIDLNDSNCTKDDTDIVFSFDTADGKRARRKASSFDGSDASVEVAVGELKMGEQEICAEAVRRDGTVVGKRTMKFTRLECRPDRPVWIDRNRRVMVDGKPFFPITMYCSHPQSNMIERIGKSPCNTIMAYGKLDWAMLDWCRANGLMACPYVGDLSSKDASVAKRMNKIKDHPAIFSWLMNDERPLAALPQLHSRYRTIMETDPGRPAWAVLYQVDDMRGYVGTCDAIGSDPYPLPHASVNLAYDWVEKTRKATFGALSLWQTIQVFDWAAYKTKGQSDPDVPKYRAPTLEEMKIMAWMQIAGGANALLMYSYNPVEKMDWRDPFEKKWAEICECANEIAAASDIILSVEKAPELKGIPSGLSVRTWRKDGKVHLLVCNTSGKSLKGNLPLSDEFSGKMRTVFGGGAIREGDSLLLDFPLEGYAFLAFDR